MDPTCENCKFGHHHTKGSMEWIECHRSPPAIVEDEDFGRIAEWPPVSATDWCGEFESNEIIATSKPEGMR